MCETFRPVPHIATQADLDTIITYLDRGGASSNFEGFEGRDAKLHRAIALAAHNTLLMNMFDVMNTARSLPVRGTLKRRTSTPERRQCYHTEHTAIVEALDPHAAQNAMRTHLQHVADNLLGRN